MCLLPPFTNFNLPAWRSSPVDTILCPSRRQDKGNLSVGFVSRVWAADTICQERQTALIQVDGPQGTGVMGPGPRSEESRGFILRDGAALQGA